jgi:uncharacterized caspase-like protein
MVMISALLRTFFTLLILLAPLAAAAGVPEKRLALVIGNAAYKAGALATPVNDAALVAETLRTQGFEVTGSRDLDTKRLRQAFEEFRGKVGASGSGSVIVIYFAGLGLQLEGDNYLIPVDAVPTGTADIRRDAVQLSGLIRSLAELGPRSAFVVLDAARKNPFSIADGPLAGGFAWVEPDTNFLVALNAAPGTVASNNGASFGPYAIALAEMLGQGGLSSGDLFVRVRLRVNEATNGGQVPWHNAKLADSFVLAERPLDAPQRTDGPESTRPFRTRPMRTLSAGDAYFTALMRDTFDGYSEFLAEYWRDPMTSRVRALLAARREVLTWHRSTETSTANGYWTYLERYPHGPHVADAQRWLMRAGAAVVPPSSFTRMECDVPTLLPDERQYIERTALNFGDPELAFGPPLPVPNYFLSASTLESRLLAVPSGTVGDHDLPALMPVASRKANVPVAVAPLIPGQAPESNDAQAKVGDVANLTSPVPPSARAVSPNPTAGATITTSATPTVAAVPWISGGPSYQSVSPSANTQRQATPPSAPSAPGGRPVSDMPDQPPRGDVSAGQPALGPSSRGPALGAVPLPLPRPGERGAQAARRAVRTVNPSAPPTAAAAAGAGAPGRAQQLSLRPSLEAPTQTSPPRTINGSLAVTGAVPRARPAASTGKPAAPPVRTPAADALSEKPAAIPAD